MAKGSVALDMGVDFTGNSKIPEGTGIGAPGAMAFDGLEGGAYGAWMASAK